jgi:hypothetical protein
MHDWPTKAFGWNFKTKIPNSLGDSTQCLKVTESVTIYREREHATSNKYFSVNFESK